MSFQLETMLFIMITGLESIKELKPWNYLDIRDYIHIGYYGTDYLYIPVDQIDKILKYASKEGHVPTLTKLGTNQWANTKKENKKEIKRFV